MNTPRYVLYTRVSTEGQRDNFSHDSQLDALQNYVANRSGRVVDIIRETASGNSIAARPGIQRALELLETNQADVLLCYDFSRFSRNVEHQHQLLRRLDAVGKRIEFATFELTRDGNGQLTPESGLQFGIFGTFVAFHRTKMRADCKRGMVKSAISGLQPNRTKSPFGYRIITKADVLNGTATPGTQGTYEVIEELRPVIVELFERKAAGETLLGLADWLNSNNVPVAQRGGRWWPSSLQSIFANTIYYGEARYGKKIKLTDDSRIERGYTSRKYKVKSQEEAIVIPAPAIISRELWEKCNEVKSRVRPRKHDGQHLYLLTGVLSCPLCSGPMTGVTELRGPKNNKAKVGYYACRASSPHYARSAGLEKCDRQIIESIKAESIVKNALTRLFDNGDFLNQLSPDKSSLKKNQQAQELASQIDALDQREGTLIQAQLRALEAGADSTAYETMLGQIGREKRTLKEKRERLEKSLQNPEQLKQQIAEIARYFAADQNNANSRALRHSLGQLFKRIWLENDSVKFETQDV
jgi:DNA invertase Pin-like site-specific DNA recombinase